MIVDLYRPIFRQLSVVFMSHGSRVHSTTMKISSFAQPEGVRPMSPRDHNTKPALAIGVDIGRTKIAVGVVSDTGDLIERVVVPTPGGNVAIVEVIDEISKKLMAQYPAVSVLGVGTPEVVEWPSGVTIDPGDSGPFPLRSCLEDLIGLPTVVDSDANVAAWAEFRFGAAVGKPNVVLVTVGTGIGGGVIIDGGLYRGTRGFAGEIGHMVVDPLGEVCSCGNMGCWEAIASGTALGRNGKRASASDPGGLMATLAGGAERVTGEFVSEAAHRGDPTAVCLIQKAGHWLGVGIASMVLIFDPDVVVIGGGLVENGEQLLSAARVQAERNTRVRRNHLPPILRAFYGADAGVVGAAALAMDTLSGLIQPGSRRIGATADAVASR
jgi:glucokinase